MKDASDIYVDNPGLFKARVESLMNAADTAGSELGAVLLDVEAFLRRYIVLPSDHEAVAITLWIAHTFAYEQADTSPYLGVTSAEKRCGKTRTLDVLSLLVSRPWRAVMPSEAVTYRKIDRDRPTLLLDEIDAVFGTGLPKQYEGLRALLNAGNRHDATVGRVSGPGMKLVDFNVFCPKVLAGIGELPETVADRCIPIRLKRKSAREQVERFRFRIAAPVAAPTKVALDAAMKAHSLGGSADVPEELDDRAADSWEPLIEIAEHAGGDWPRRARKTAIALSAGRDSDSDSVGVRLLTDIWAYFNLSGFDRVASVTLVNYLLTVEESPWREMGRDGINPTALARLLRPFGVRPGNLRMAEGVPKGYDVGWFKDAFARYVPNAATPATPLQDVELNEPE